MAYNYFPTNYPYYQPTQAQGNTSLIWVQGEAAAKSYYVAPNNTVPLWDSESQTIYLKTADASGMPSMRVLEYTFRDAQKAQESVSDDKTDYVTKNDLEAVYGQIRDLKEEIEGLSIRRPSKKKEGDE